VTDLRARADDALPWCPLPHGHGVCVEQSPFVALAAARVGLSNQVSSTEAAPGVGVSFNAAGLGPLPPNASSVDMYGCALCSLGAIALLTHTRTHLHGPQMGSWGVRPPRLISIA
jgi:hypothetical protein